MEFPPDPPMPDAEPPSAPGLPRNADWPEDSPPAAPNFCGQCGAPWAPGALACAQCADRAAPARPHIALNAEGGSLKSALGLYFALLAISLGTVIACFAGVESVNLDFAASTAMAIVVGAACLGRQRRVIRPLLRWGPPGGLLAALGLSIVTFALAIVIVAGTDQLVDAPSLRYSTAYLEAGYGWGTILFMVAVVPAVVEEFAFRGVILQSLQPLLSPREAVVVSALMFMILHLSVLNFPHTFLLGLAAGWLCVRTRSLLPGIVLHFLHNSYCVAFEWLCYS